MGPDPARSPFPILLLALLLAATFVQAADTGRTVDRSALWRRGGVDVLSGFRNMYNFRVIHDPADPRYPYKAWFFGWAAEDGNPYDPGCDAIYTARSAKLSSGWEVYAGPGLWDATGEPRLWVPVVTAQNQPTDQWHNGDPSVVKVGGRYFMAYSSTGFNLDGKLFGTPGDTDGSILCIMGATSGDGVHWRKSPEPILLHQEDLGAPPIPEGEAHLYGSYHRPSLLYDAPARTFRLWFDYWAGPEGGCAMGYAENVGGDFLDSSAWRVVRAGKTPCLPHFPNPNVVRVGTRYHAFADGPVNVGPDAGHPWKARKIIEAVSENGLDWTELGYVEPDADSPAIHVPEAFVQREGDKTMIYVFYACQNGGEPEYDYRYSRIRWMRRSGDSPRPTPSGAGDIAAVRDADGLETADSRQLPH
ncbi:MAG TPA: hypothetical protein PLD23_01880 [Armatimonadota bacterium]|mgnify:CR=1 FL=1|nr:hypothetical protein [Armatimonadota bacterium]HQK92222.1 hypothetical protein [Armatimonadota bacterium]